MKIKFTYFKQNGKYYSEGEFDAAGWLSFWGSLAEIQEMLKEGKNPGLIDGAVIRNGFDTLITAEEWPPHLLTFKSLSQGEEWENDT